MSIETLRNEIRGIEQEIQELNKLPHSLEVFEARNACFERKWELERQIKLVTKAA